MYVQDPCWSHGLKKSWGKRQDAAECVSPQVYITVLDENDNSPRFDFTSDSAISVPEDCPVGQRVATVKAQDPDAGSNGQVGIKPGSTQAVGCFPFLKDHLSHSCH